MYKYFDFHLMVDFKKKSKELYLDYIVKINNDKECWIKKDNKFIKWMTDWNENLYALKYFGLPYKINSCLCVYNQDTNKTRTENNNFKEMINFFKNKFI